MMACAPGNAIEVALTSSEPFVGAGSDLPFAWGRALGSAAVVAVRGDNMVRGALCVLSRREDAYWAEELGFLRTAVEPAVHRRCSASTSSAGSPTSRSSIRSPGWPTARCSPTASRS